jgi:hypothetical protein
MAASVARDRDDPLENRRIGLMKNIGIAILAVCLGTLGNLAAQTNNTKYGTSALSANTTGYNNTAFGDAALVDNTTGYSNTATGALSLFYNISGYYNTADGVQTLVSNNYGNYNTALGAYALALETMGTENTATGAFALYGNSGGYDNTATGVFALSDATGSYNTATGADSLRYETTGSYNLADGFYSLTYNTTGAFNVAVGPYSFSNNNSGSFNIGLGYAAGYYNPALASDNIDIGSYGGVNDYNTIRIGTPNIQTSFYAAGVDGVAISGPVPVYINSNGQLGTVNSSIRLKEDVHDMAAASDGLMHLRPVTYRYKQPYADGSKPIDYGLIAEEVAQVYPDLVVKDADGQIQTVQYQKLTPMLLNEVQKQHRLLEEQEKTIQQLEKQLAAMPLLEKRLAALEAAQPSAKLEARLVTK